MTKQQKHSRKNKPVTGTTTHKRSKARPKKTKESASAVPVKRNWSDPVLFLMLVIIAIPMLGPTPQMQGLPWVIRLSFLLPALPLLLIYIGYKKTAITISLQPVMLTLWGIVLLAVVSSCWAVIAEGASTGSV